MGALSQAPTWSGGPSPGGPGGRQGRGPTCLPTGCPGAPGHPWLHRVVQGILSILSILPAGQTLKDVFLTEPLANRLFVGPLPCLVCRATDPLYLETSSEPVSVSQAHTSTIE